MILAGAPMAALAQEPDLEEAPPPKTEGEGSGEGEAAATPVETRPKPQEVAPAPAFQIRRGFFAESDLGVYLTIGGRNTNDVGLPTRGTSNVQPYLGVTIGYDVLHSEAFSLALGLKLAAGYSAGAGRVTDADIAAKGVDVLTTRPNDYSVLEAGAAVMLAIMLTERIALTVKADGGLGVLSPDPFKDATEAGAGSSAFGPIFGGGLGVEYFTLLNDFSVGLDLRFVMAIGDAAIPGLSATIPIKYTF